MEHSLFAPDDPRLWVAVAFVLFVALFYKKIGGAVVRALDERSAKIKADLDEARRLHDEAAALLAEYKQKQSEYLQEAASILAGARKDAEKLYSFTEKELKATMDVRMKQALERIEQEETKAVNDVRNHVVDIALAAARALIVDQVSAMSQDDLLKLALTDIEHKIH